MGLQLITHRAVPDLLGQGMLSLIRGQADISEAEASEVPKAVGLALGSLAAAASLLALFVASTRLRHVKASGAKIHAVLFPTIPKNVARTMEKRRIGLCRVILDSVFMVCVLPSLPVIAILCYLQVFPEAALYIATYSEWLLLSILSTLFVYFRGYDLRAIDALLAAVFLLVGGLPLFASNIESHYFAAAAAKAVHAVLAMAGMNTWRFLPLNLVHLAWQIWLTSTLQLSKAALVQDIFLALLTTTYNMVMCFASNTLLRLMAEDEVEAKRAVQSEEVVQSLLSMMCDAVVTLTPDLNFRDACPRIASLLLRADLSGAPRSDQSFSKYLAPLDVPRFEDFMAQSSNDEQLTRCIHVHLLDSLGTRVPVQIFHTRMTDSEGAQSHVLGVVEDMDRNPRNSKEGVTSSAASHGTSFHSPLTSWGPLGKVSVVLRTKLFWEVLHESPASRTFFGFGMSSDPEEFINRFQQPRRLLHWMKYLHTMACCGRVDHPRLAFGVVNFFNPSAGSSYSGSLRGRIIKYPEGGEEDEDPLEVDAEVVDIELQFEPSRSEERRQRQRPSLRANGPLVAGGNKRIRL